MSHSGVIVAGDANVDTTAAVAELAALVPGLAGAWCSSEGDYPIVPLVVGHSSFVGEGITPTAVLTALGAHRQLIDALEPIDFDAGMLGTAAPTVQAWLTRHSDGGPPLVFRCGSEQLNPLPVFWLLPLGNHAVAGVMSCLVHT